jgi:hypothetical protein
MVLQHRRSNFRLFFSLHKGTLCLLAVIPHFPQPLATIISFLSTGLPILYILYKWDFVFCDLWHLASFTQHSVFKVHPHCNSCQYFIAFYGWILFHCIDNHISFSNHQYMDSELLLHLGYYKHCCHKQSRPSVFIEARFRFSWLYFT